MRPRVYIDTSVIGGCFDEEFAEWSKRLFDEFRMGVKIAVVSDVTHRELVDAPRAIRDILEDLPEGSIEEIAPSAEIRELAEAYVQSRGCGAHCVRFCPSRGYCGKLEFSSYCELGQDKGV